MGAFERTINLIGQDNFDKIQSKKIIVFGVGGVGGYVVEMLVRSGVHNLTIVDFDKVNESNLNRQIIALNSTMNFFKVSAFKDRILDINPLINLHISTNRVSAENLDEFFLEQYDYVIDCIDSFKDKLALIEYCKRKNINIISSMGAGNRYRSATFEIVDLFKTQNNALAKKLRVELKKRGIKNLTVCSTKSPNDNIVDKTKVFSVSYNVALCGVTIASFVINDIIES
ncbi:MAG: ThiF family adenylyltransferase [Christensenellales bacterium]